MTTLLSNSELRARYESQMLNNRVADQIQKDIFATANSEGRDQDDADFLDEFWANYCPEDDGNEWVRED